MLPNYKIGFQMSFKENYEPGLSTEGLEDLELPSENDLTILKAIGDDTDAQNLSFQGIKRKLGVHQETLSRSLRRLQRDGYVEHLEHAYRISDKGLSTINQNRLPNSVQVEEPYSVPLLQAMLPSDLNEKALVDSLRYRWFGTLRWLGSSENGHGVITLTWITEESGLKVSVKIRESSLTIETIPKNAKSISEATRSAFALFDHISKALREDGRISSIPNPA